METISLPLKFNNLLGDFIKVLKDTYQNDLISISLYGSAATKEFSKKHSNINICVILKDTSLKSLSKIQRIVNKNKFSILSPVFFTEEYMNRSTDVFPIEFLDMKENHLVLYGKDLLNDLEIDIKNLRFQCEQELKSKLINIKRAYLRVNRFNLKYLLFTYFTSTLYIFKNLLRLKGKNQAYSKKDVLSQLEKEFHIQLIPFVKILDAKTNNLRLSFNQTKELFFDFVNGLEKIIEIIDAF